MSPGMHGVIDDIASVSPPGALSDPTIPESERAPSVATRSTRCNAWGPLRPGYIGFEAGHLFKMDTLALNSPSYLKIHGLSVTFFRVRVVAFFRIHGLIGAFFRVRVVTFFHNAQSFL